ncbi:fructose-bisphosphate aldolase [Bacillus sp. YZJH907-2]|uniref:Fructose-bisphosphate aldolase n=2 Tax=Halalkalibacter suaedae TaxID=2822140 RepID=A0A941APQ3_9BACI|nr:fructose-bisphosphate aldolase [Bacillus suaedae]
MLVVLSFLFLTVNACINSQDPKITVEAVVSHLSDEEFDEVGLHGLEDPSKDGSRKFTIDFEVEHSSTITSKVEFPRNGSWQEAINSIDSNRDRYWFGEGYEQNNDDANVARYYREFVFYSKGLDKQEISEAFNSIIIDLYLDKEEGDSIEKEYKVSDLVEFDENKTS